LRVGRGGKSREGICPELIELCCHVFDQLRGNSFTAQSSVPGKGNPGPKVRGREKCEAAIDDTEESFI
jgi:hypothetical protein